MAEENTVQIGNDLLNLGKAVHIEKTPDNKVRVDYGHHERIIKHSTGVLADETMDIIDAAIDAVSDDIWYTKGDERFHLGACSSVQKRDVNADPELWFYFDHVTKKLKYPGDPAQRNSDYSSIKSTVEASTDATLWTESDDENVLFNFDNIAIFKKESATVLRVIHSGGMDNSIVYASESALDADIASFKGDVADASVHISVEQALSESNLDGAVVEVNLVNETFADDTLSGGNFTLNNAPTGTTVDSVEHVDENTAKVTLAFDGTDFDTNVTDFSITVAAAELSGGSNLQSNDLTITAVVE